MGAGIEFFRRHGVSENSADTCMHGLVLAMVGPRSQIQQQESQILVRRSRSLADFTGVQTQRSKYMQIAHFLQNRPLIDSAQ